MWDARRISRTADLEFATSVVELFETTSRSLMLVVGGVVVLCLLIAAVLAGQFTQDPVNVYVVIFLAGLVCAFAVYLHTRHHIAAQIVWQAGLVVVVTLAVCCWELNGPDMGARNTFEDHHVVTLHNRGGRAIAAPFEVRFSAHSATVLEIDLK